MKLPLRRSVGRGMALVCALSVVACSGAAPVVELESSALCQRSKREKTIVVAHVDERGEAFQGDAPRGEYDGVVSKIPTALAAPKTAVITRRERKDCYDKAKDVWYPCIKELRVDFSKIRGIARAPKMDRARRLATQLCESEVRRKSPKEGGYLRIDSAQYHCTVVQTNLCPVYKATAAQKKEKKRLSEERKRGQPKYEINPNCPSTQHCLPKRR
ncbi:MAG: hypothetical protein OEQ29_02610 [Alphaproteobacteria bacterium]|nr:hypothetical protein [Alphaproteobacteria bacterium]